MQGGSHSPGQIARRDYTGRYVVAHTVQAGQTLSMIAEAYRLPGWKPIWLYNTEVEKTIGKNPNMVARGVTIYIPRSKDGYDLLIRKLEASKIAVECNAKSQEYYQESLKNEYEAEAVKWNAVGDALTFVASVSVKALQAAKAARVAKAAVGQAKIAANLAAHAESQRFAQMLAGRRNVLTGKALDAARAARANRTAVTSAIKSKAVEVLGQAVDENKAKVLKTGTSAHEAMRLTRELREGLLHMGKYTVEMVGIALDYLEVSTVAGWLIWLRTGQTFEQVQRETTANVEATAKRMSEHFDKKIDDLCDERDLLYGT